MKNTVTRQQGETLRTPFFYITARGRDVVLTATTVPVTEIIVDNPAAAFVGSWPTSTSTAGYYGSNYQTNTTGTGTETATWSFSITTAGNYQVYAWWTAYSNRATNAPYMINYGTGTATVLKNQQVNGGSWQLLGTYYFATGTRSVRLTDNANGYVIAARGLALGIELRN
jgi:hypothetical protein